MTIHDAREDRFGRYFEEFTIGDVYRHWPGRTITEAEDHLFCMLTMAASPIHVATDKYLFRRSTKRARELSTSYSCRAWPKACFHAR